MRVIIYATAGEYKGSHGIYNLQVVEVNSLDEADDIGQDMCDELLEDYSRLWDEDEDEHEVNWEWARVMSKFNNIPIEQLDAEASKLGYDEFVERYCTIDDETFAELLATLKTNTFTDGVGHTEVGAYTVDTCYGDNAYETAIWLNPNRMAIPAIYPNRAAAESGHKFWCIAAAAEPTKVWDAIKQQYVIL